MEYQFLHLKLPTSNAYLELRNIITSIDLTNTGASTWGVFHGVFGLATNELYWVLLDEQDNSQDVSSLDQIVRALNDQGVLVLSQKRFSPTVRPLQHILRTTPGIYVFRWFDVDGQNVDEIASLSKEAWNTFEAGFDTQVQGLFAEAETDDASNSSETMLLVTWYRDLTVWQDSREPHPNARKLFLRRHQLMREAKPIATRLLPQES